MKVKILSAYKIAKALEEPVNDFLKQDHILGQDVKVLYSDFKVPTYTAVITYRDLREEEM